MAEEEVSEEEAEKTDLQKMNSHLSSITNMLIVIAAVLVLQHCSTIFEGENRTDENLSRINSTLLEMSHKYSDSLSGTSDVDRSNAELSNIRKNLDAIRRKYTGTSRKDW